MTREEAKALRDRLGAKHNPPVFFAICAHKVHGFAVAEKTLVYTERDTRARVVRIITDKDATE